MMVMKIQGTKVQAGTAYVSDNTLNALSLLAYPFPAISLREALLISRGN